MIWVRVIERPDGNWGERWTSPQTRSISTQVAEMGRGLASLGDMYPEQPITDAAPRRWGRSFGSRAA
jgi:hypothetical protein